MKHVLIIEDDDVDQYIAKTILTKIYPDIKVTSAYDGEEALKLLQTMDSKPDVVLLDINMPRMGGLEFLETYAPEHDGKTPVVVMLTSSDQYSDKSTALSYTFVSDFFEKPMTGEKAQKLAEIADNS